MYDFPPRLWCNNFHLEAEGLFSARSSREAARDA